MEENTGTLRVVVVDRLMMRNVIPRSAMRALWRSMLGVGDEKDARAPSLVRADHRTFCDAFIRVLEAFRTQIATQFLRRPGTLSS